MAHLPGSRKRRAEPAAAGLVPSPATAVKAEVDEEGFIDGNGPLLKRFKAVPKPPVIDQQVWPLRFSHLLLYYTTLCFEIA